MFFLHFKTFLQSMLQCGLWFAYRMCRIKGHLIVYVARNRFKHDQLRWHIQTYKLSCMVNLAQTYKRLHKLRILYSNRPIVKHFDIINKQF